MIYIFLWIIPHFLIGLNFRFNSLINFVSLSVLILLISIKPITYDLTWYHTYFEIVHKNLHELGFEFIVSILNFLLNNKYLIHHTLSYLCVFILFISLKRYLNISGTKLNFLLLAIIIGSVFFAVGSQNNVRMFTALAIAISSLLFIKSTDSFVEKLFFGILFLLSSLVHWSTGFILAFTVISFVIDNLLNEEYFLNHHVKNLIRKLLFFLIGLIGTILFIFITNDKSWIYFDQSIIADQSFYEAGRSSNFMKMIYIIFLFFVTTVFTFREKIDDSFVNIRGNIIFFMIPFSFVLPVEGFARLFFVYFAFEFVSLAVYSVHRSKVVRLSFFAVFFLYAFAMNAVNIMSGINYLI